MKHLNKCVLTLLASAMLLAQIGCKKGANTTVQNPVPITPVPPVTQVLKSDVAMWLTQADQKQLLQKQNVQLSFSTSQNQNLTINVDTSKTYQTIDGFGFALTGGSASLINSLEETKKSALISELFDTAGTHIGVSYVRISLGASDLSSSAFCYDDKAGDTELTNFSLDKEKSDLIPILKRIVAINPKIKILACPWSAPAWMKDSNSFSGGSLKPEYYGVYAKYFVKYIQGMQAQGINIDAITPQNEPLNPYNNPSMLMLSVDQGKFIKNNLGPEFQKAGIKTKIIVYDHNADHPEFATTIYQDKDANPYIDGAAFHLYGGNINALGPVHDQFPDKNIYFTEQATFAGGDFGADLAYHTSNLIIGATRNWSRNVLEWNLASDPQLGPHTNGGCSTCLGAVTISSDFSRNVSYYIVAHASKFVHPGAVRIYSDLESTIQTVAFKNTDGTKVLIALNAGPDASFNIKYNSKTVTTFLKGGAVATYIW
jgi:glucosylceramidase